MRGKTSGDPKNKHGEYKAQHEGCYHKAFDEWVEERNKWNEGYRLDWTQDGRVFIPKDIKDKNLSFEDWTGEAPDSRYYMKQFPENEKTHLMMFETCSEGTPISPAFKTEEELAKWLADNKASASGDMTTNYEAWLKMIKNGSSCAMVIINNKIMSGVEACSYDDTKEVKND